MERLCLKKREQGEDSVTKSTQVIRETTGVLGFHQDLPKEAEPMGDFFCQQVNLSSATLSKFWQKCLWTTKKECAR